MTKQRNDEHSTEFGLWLRRQPEIDSKLGYVASNIDYVWKNYNTGEWMLIEEKRYRSEIGYCQGQIFNTLIRAAKRDEKYRGFFLIQFENKDPEDGRLWINGRPGSKRQLLNLLLFKKVKYEDVNEDLQQENRRIQEAF